MKTTIIAIGKLKERYWREACAEYAKRLSGSATLAVVELPDCDPARLGVQRALWTEGAAVLKALPAQAWVIALAIRAPQYTSEEFSARLDALKLAGHSHLCFVIGSSHGLAPEVLERANEQLSFGPITLPHNLARVVLLEQLYRAATISQKGPYHK
ncbi:MAG: 23S rRNA (pseudouridine(1915)-N(3))-methyltransferase RlmH [Coriobacteriia bacterium]|nr:23S rRNA (pseudouridine(1915)-N(3))-methyltransferase RlmH [Coriobacteriia bacterium]